MSQLATQFPPPAGHRAAPGVPSRATTKQFGGQASPRPRLGAQSVHGTRRRHDSYARGPLSAPHCGRCAREDTP